MFVHLFPSIWPIPSQGGELMPKGGSFCMQPPLSNALLEQDCRIAGGPPWLEHIHASLLTAEMLLLLLMAPRGKQDLELSAGCRPQW